MVGDVTAECSAMLAEMGYTPVWANEIQEGWEIAIVGGDWGQPNVVDFCRVTDLHRSTQYQEDGFSGGVMRETGHTIVRFFGAFDDGRSMPYSYGQHIPIWVKAA